MFVVGSTFLDQRDALSPARIELILKNKRMDFTNDGNLTRSSCFI